MGSAGIAQLVEQLICNSRKNFCPVFFTGLRRIADARCLSHFGFAQRYAELRRFAGKNCHTVENDRERVVPFSISEKLNAGSIGLSAPVMIPRCAAPDAAVPLDAR